MDQLENAKSALNKTTSTHGDRLDDLEMEISFSVVTSADINLDENPTIFDIVRGNNGLGYDNNTGNAKTILSYLIDQFFEQISIDAKSTAALLGHASGVLEKN